MFENFVSKIFFRLFDLFCYLLFFSLIFLEHVSVLSSVFKSIKLILESKLKKKPKSCPIANCGKDYQSSADLAKHYAHNHGIAIRSGSPRPIMKTRTAFYLRTNSTTRLSRILCRHLIRSKKAARQPQYAVNLVVVKQECKYF